MPQLARCTPTIPFLLGFASQQCKENNTRPCIFVTFHELAFNKAQDDPDSRSLRTETVERFVYRESENKICI